MNTAFFILLLAGLFLIGAEVFVPGGVLGLIGGLCLVGAVIMAFHSFPPQVALLIAVGIVLLLGLCLFLWIRFFPKTRLGKSLALDQNGKQFKAAPTDLAGLIGKEGVTQTELRPAGIAKFNGRRVDVIAEEGWVDAHAAVRVIEVQGNRVVVRRVSPPRQTAATEGPA